MDSHIKFLCVSSLLWCTDKRMHILYLQLIVGVGVAIPLDL